jgi:hypothetical protein
MVILIGEESHSIQYHYLAADKEIYRFQEGYDMSEEVVILSDGGGAWRMSKQMLSMARYVSHPERYDLGHLHYSPVFEDMFAISTQSVNELHLPNVPNNEMKVFLDVINRKTVPDPYDHFDAAVNIIAHLRRYECIDDSTLRRESSSNASRSLTHASYLRLSSSLLSWMILRVGAG